MRPGLTDEVGVGRGRVFLGTALTSANIFPIEAHAGEARPDQWSGALGSECRSSARHDMSPFSAALTFTM